MNDFLWVPGCGYDEEALQRLRKHFRRPKQSMGEAWFMGEERKMFGYLAGDLDQLSVRELEAPLVELASGTSSFGEMAEWTSWFHYLLGALIPRSHERNSEYLLEHLITGFISQYRDGIEHEPYRGFESDILNTLGKSIMDSACWKAQDIVTGAILDEPGNHRYRDWPWWDASGDFSAAVFFCLKYLPEAAITPWFRSVMSIASAHWRAQLIGWLVGAHDILHNKVGWPSEFEEAESPKITWAWSHCLRPDDTPILLGTETKPVPPMIPAGNSMALLRVVAEVMTEDVFLDWLASIARFPELEAELAELPDTFERLYPSSPSVYIIE
jgi:hypothetical protein